MTLHWWMHWFWVTSHLSGVVVGFPLGQATPTSPATLTEQTTSLSPSTLPTVVAVTVGGANVSNATTVTNDPGKERDVFAPGYVSLEENSRIPKAISSSGGDDVPFPQRSETRKTNDDWSKRENLNLSLSSRNTTAVNNRNDSGRSGSSSDISGSSSNNNSHDSRNDSGTIEVVADAIRTGNDTGGTTLRSSQLLRDSKITWIDTSNETAGAKIVESTIDASRKGSTNEGDSLDVLPLPDPRFKLVLNRTRVIPSTDKIARQSFNKSEDVEITEERINGELRFIVTASSILQGGISESPRLSRARSAFEEDTYRQSQQATLEQRQDIQNFEVVTNGTASAVDIAAVTGSCLATILLLGTMASLGFVMYRKRYLNPPQTLNSDKCSNPDSSGYIDDSTIRDNSEEMYSLDNDSFLNSLEAMTIQNYWTDSVKHTKL